VSMHAGILKRAAVGLVAALPLLASGAPTFAAASQREAAATATAQLTTPAAKLRIALSELMGAHAWLAVRAMEQGYAGSPEYAGTVAALSRNTDQLTRAIASVYGWKAAATFRKVWAAHIGDFVDYVVATKAGNRAGQQKALAALQGYTTASAQFFAGLNPNLDAATLKAGLAMHIAQLITAFKDDVAGNGTGAAMETVAAYDHMFDMADALSTAIAAQFPNTFSGNPNAPGVNLNVALDELLGAHAVLALNAMEEDYSGSANFAGTAAALNADTQGLGAAIGSVYGSKAETAFDALWTQHIGYFVDLVAAWKANDGRARVQALAHLQAYKAQFAAFLASANPEVDPTAVADALQVHIHELSSTFDAYRLGQYPKAALGEVYAYDHMFMTGGYLAQVIVAQYPSKFGA
jgi:hypothetical protein